MISFLRHNSTNSSLSLCQTLINEFYTSTLDILESDWLISDLTISDRRSTEMAAIRQLIIPHLIMRLHFALYESGSIIPRYVTLAKSK